MKKKSVLSMLLALLLAASATACAKTAAPEPAGSAAGSVSEAVSSASEAASASEASADAPDATRFEALVAANTAEETLSRHSSAAIEQVLLYKDETISTQKFYSDGSVIFCEMSPETVNGNDLWCSSDTYVFSDGADGNTLNYYLSDDPTFYSELLEEAKEGVFLHIDEAEELISTEEKDGRFVACTIMSNTEKFVETIGRYYENTDGWENLKQMSIRFRYVFDLAGGDILTIETYLVDVDGTEYQLSRSDSSFDIDFDPTATEGPLSLHFHPGDEARKVTITYAAGTDQAHTSEYTLPRDVNIGIYTNGDFAEDWYLDAECTQLYEEDNGTQDLELYVK